MTYEHQLSLRVRYRDTDCGGVVYHSNFIDYFEWGRTELLRARGASYRAMEEAGDQLVVIDLAVQYRAPAHYDDELIVETRVEYAEGVRIGFSYRILRPSTDTLICTGTTTLACVDGTTGRPKRPPAAILERLS